MFFSSDLSLFIFSILCWSFILTILLSSSVSIFNPIAWTLHYINYSSVSTGFFLLFYLFFHLEHSPLSSNFVCFFLFFSMQLCKTVTYPGREGVIPMWMHPHTVSLCPVVLLWKLSLKWGQAMCSPRARWQLTPWCGIRLEMEGL